MSYTRLIINVIVSSFKVFILSMKWAAWAVVVRPVFCAVRWILGK